jgi:hypothetical protein
MWTSVSPCPQLRRGGGEARAGRPAAPEQWHRHDLRGEAIRRCRGGVGAQRAIATAPPRRRTRNRARAHRAQKLVGRRRRRRIRTRGCGGGGSGVTATAFPRLGRRRQIREDYFSQVYKHVILPNEQGRTPVQVSALLKPIRKTSSQFTRVLRNHGLVGGSTISRLQRQYRVAVEVTTTRAEPLHHNKSGV